MELDIIAAKDFIAGNFRNAGDFDFIPDEQLEEIRFDEIQQVSDLSDEPC